MTAPEASPLPWRNELDGSDYGHMRDANNEVVEIYGDHGNELRARIIAAVNSHAPLLAAAKQADAYMTFEPWKDAKVIDELRAAIAAAEEHQTWTE